MVEFKDSIHLVWSSINLITIVRFKVTKATQNNNYNFMTCNRPFQIKNNAKLQKGVFWIVFKVKFLAKKTHSYRLIVLHLTKAVKFFVKVNFFEKVIILVSIEPLFDLLLQLFKLYASQQQLEWLKTCLFTYLSAYQLIQYHRMNTYIEFGLFFNV